MRTLNNTLKDASKYMFGRTEKHATINFPFASAQPDFIRHFFYLDLDFLSAEIERFFSVKFTMIFSFFHSVNCKMEKIQQTPW